MAPKPSNSLELNDLAHRGYLTVPVARLSAGSNLINLTPPFERSGANPTGDAVTHNEDHPRLPNGAFGQA